MATQAATGVWRQRSALGLAIVLGGQPVAWAIRGMVSDSQSTIFPALAVLTGLGLMLRMNWLWQRALHTPVLAVALPTLGLLAPMVVMSLAHPVELAVYGAYAAFLVLVVLAIALQPACNFAALLPAMIVVGSISLMAPILQIMLFGVAEGFYRLAVVGNENPLILATIGSITFFAVVVMFSTSRSQSLLMGMLYAVLMALSFGVVLLTNTRSALLGVVGGLLLYPLIFSRRAPMPGRGSRRMRSGFAGTFLAATLGAPMLLAAVIGPEAMGVFADRTGSRLESTLGTFFGDDLQIDASSMGRVAIIEETVAGLSPFGQGMMAQALVMGQGYYPHLTYLHAFYDLGIFGGLMFFALAFVIPAAILWRRFLAGGLDRNTMFVMLLFLYSQTDHLTHGAPYSWTTLVPALLAYALIWRPAGMKPIPLSFRLRADARMRPAGA